MRWHVASLMVLASVMACGTSTDGNGAESAATGSAQRDSSAIAAESPDDARCGIAGDTGAVLSGRGLGAIRVGMPFEALRTKCRVVADSTDPLGNEGMPERRAIVALDDDSATVIVYDDRVHRIELTSARFRTADSTGVGTHAVSLRERGGRLLTGDRGVFVTLPDECGLSFRLENIPVGGGTWSAIPDSTPVSLVLVTGCD